MSPKRAPHRFSTQCVHSGCAPDPTTGAITMPIYATSTYVHTAPGEHKGYFYARHENPTRAAFEKAIAILEEGASGFAFSSGMAAIAAILELLPQGAHIIASDDIYGGTYALFEQIKKKSSGLSVSYVDMTRLENLQEALTPATGMLWIETPTNPLLKLADIRMVTDFSRKNGLISAVDNTFATPWAQKPITLGADLVMHSITKYIGGHSDIIGGVVVVGDRPDLQAQMKSLQTGTGGILGPFESFLAHRGLKTLDVRMARHIENTEKIAKWLSGHPKIERVYYPGLPHHPHHQLAKKQMRGFGAMITVVVKGDDLEAARRFLCGFQVFALAVSLGGVESLVQHPAIMTHAGVPKAQREKLGITDGLVRISVGIEDAEDLIADLDQALKAV